MQLKLKKYVIQFYVRRIIKYLKHLLKKKLVLLRIYYFWSSRFKNNCPSTYYKLPSNDIMRITHSSKI